MKKTLLILSLLIYSTSNAQIVDIPDANFKQALLNYSIVIDTNNDGEIQVNEVQNLLTLNLSQKNISDLTGIEEFVNLKKLNCSVNQLTTLDVSSNVNLTTLYCGNNQLTTLDLSNNINLNRLFCTNNQLTVLNINNINLTNLWCENNQLTILDISDSTNLEELHCFDNQLTTLDISNNTNLDYLICNSNQLTSLDISNNMNLGFINCNSNQLTSLDISNNINLSILYCSNNQLSVLNTSNNTNLRGLECNSNQLTSLDISNNMSLYSLAFSSNQLTTLDISNNTNLHSLNCSENPLTTLDISNNTSLTTLKCNSNQLTFLDISNNTNLRDLSCSSNELTSLDVSILNSLLYLSCDNNQITTLDISNSTGIRDLSCSFNQLTYLNIGSITSLKSLNCNSNQLVSLDISDNTNLNDLTCSGNSLTSLDISNTGLIDLNCSSNQLTYLNINSITSLESLNCSANQLSSIDISDIFFLKTLSCNSNLLTVLDISNNTNLRDLSCNSNLLTDLDFSHSPYLTDLSCSSNQLSSLDVSINEYLENINCSNNQLTNLNFFINTSLTTLNCSDNINLEYINLKNGNNVNFSTLDDSSNFENLPNLQTICVDELNTDLTTFITTEVGHSISFTEYCSLELAQANVINGMVNVDLDNNGCDTNDGSIQNVLVTANNGTESFSTFILEDASYSMYTIDGSFTTSITLPSYFTINPTQQTNTFTGFDNTFIANFCITPNQTVNDVNVSIIPTTQARPGFNTTYQIVYKNVGTTQLNGNVTLEFDETKLSFSNASETIGSQTSNSLTFDYSNLNPFETRTIDLEFNVSAPPTTEIDDILNFTTIINPIAGDNTTDDNIFELNQTVIGSYDPNDITCLEGNQVLFANKDKYLHYIVRFQNTGTASAINVVVKNILDNHLNWSTLQLESLSHNNRVAIKNGNEIEFIFENINLIDSTTDEPNSHGFIAYKIKPKTDIALDDVILNKADIFFDYNSPIETNTASTTIVNVLAANENVLLGFSVYPTPTENILNIKSKTEISKIEIYSKLGQKLKETTQNQIDISNLTQGLYFVKVEDVNGNFGVKKIIKK